MLRDWVYTHGTKIQLVIEHALDLVMREDQTKPLENALKKAGPDALQLTYNLNIPEYRAWLQYVVDIFNSGKQDDIDGLISNIGGFKRGFKFDELLAILQQLKKHGALPDAIANSAITEAADFSSALTRAREALKQLQDHETGKRKVRSKRIG